VIFNFHREHAETTFVRVDKTPNHADIARPRDAYVRYVWQRATFEAAEKPNSSRRAAPLDETQGNYGAA
jgi:hypothetical protein